MVADRLTVISQSADASARPAQWTSSGDGEFVVGHATDAIPRGTRVVLQLKETCKQFTNDGVVRGLLQRHSKFVNYNIMLNGNRANVVGAIWTKSKADVTDADYDYFYKRVVTPGSAGSYENPFFRLHFRTDAPIECKALLYFPGAHDEKSGMPAMKRQVSLYSRRVMIQNESDILPQWLRFVVGVVDSDDIPLNISRETMQARRPRRACHVLVCVCVCVCVCVHVRLRASLRVDSARACFWACDGALVRVRARRA